MSEEEIEKRLVDAKKETGIPVKDLRRMCLVGGLELLEKGELQVVNRNDPPKKRMTPTERLVRQVALLNPEAGEIGAGRLRNLVALARALDVEEVPV